MALDDSVLDFAVSKGMNEADDAFAQEADASKPFLADATDCIFTKDGRVQRRAGLLASALAPGAYANSIFDHNGRAFTWAEGGFTSRADSAGAYGQSMNASAPRPCEILQDPFARANEDSHDPDVASLSGYTCVVWCNQSSPAHSAGGAYPDGREVYARIVDEASGSVLLDVTLASDAQDPRVVALNGKFLVTAWSGATTAGLSVVFWTFTVATPSGAWSSPFSAYSLPVGDYRNSATYDLCVAADQTTTSDAYLSIWTGATDAKVAIVRINGTSLAVTSSASALGGVGNPLTIGVCYVYGTGLLSVALIRTSRDVELYQATAAALSGWGLADTIAMTSTSATDARIAVEQARFVAGTSHKLIIAWSSTWCAESVLASDSGVFDDSSLVTTYGYELVSKPRLLSESASDGPLVMILKWTIPDTGVARTANTQSHGVVVMREGVGSAADAHVPVARVLHGGSSSRQYQMPTGFLRSSRVSSIAISSATSGVLICAAEATTRNPLSNSTVDPNDSGIDLIRMSLRTAAKPARWMRIGGLSISDGGLLASTDGSRAFEAAVQVAPATPARESHASSRWEDSAASYNIIVGWVFYDASGKEHRTATSLPFLFASGPGGTFYSIRVSPPPLTGAGQLMLRVWKTDDLSVGTTDPNAYYLCYEGIPSDASTTPGFLLAHAEPTSGSSTNSELPYVSGGVLPAEPPPAMRDICSWQDVLVGVAADDRNLLWYTKPIEPGIAPEWNAALTVRLPADGGDVLSIAVLDDKLVCLKERAIYYCVGNTRDRLGQGTDPVVVRVASDVGCVGRNTVAVIPDGVLFVASHGRGLCLLDRGMSVRRMRQAEDRFATAASLIHSAMVVPHESCVRWGCTDGTAIVLDYEHGAMMRFTNYAATQHHVCIDGRVWTMGSGAVRAEKSATSDTVTTAAPYWTITTNWIKLAGVNGFQRQRRLLLLSTPATYSDKTAAGLRCSQWVDYNDTSSPVTATWIPDQWGPGSYGHQVEWHLSRQKCTATRYKIEEYAAPGALTNPDLVGVQLSQLSLRIGVKPSHSKKLAATSRSPT